jgi:amidohydrolase
MMKLTELRHQLHSQPDLSHREERTAETIRQFLKRCEPDKIVTGLGGHGLAAVFAGKQEGPRALVRCELDALPIPESTNLPYKSDRPDAAHKCGHDGHMTIVAGVAQELQQRRPSRGEVVLLYQPAEETGEGAALVIEDPKFGSLRPDYAVALHNLPGYPQGQVIVRADTFAAASSGISVKLKGRTSHAAEPHAGRSPARAVAQLIDDFSSLPQFGSALHESAQVTVIHARLGEIAFGTSPGEAEVMATVRSYSSQIMDNLLEQAAELARRIGSVYDLEVRTVTTQVFPATVNDPELVAKVEEAAGKLDLQVSRPEIPFAWSEDFGNFTASCPGVLFGLGAGEDHPVLHHPEYDFPDSLIVPGRNMFMQIIQSLLG